MDGRKLALVIGNSEYEDGNLSRLVTPDVDVSSLAEILRSPEVGSFDEVTALINQPTAAIRRAISLFFASRGRDDLLLLYFSGHGIRDDRGQLFLAVKDTEPTLLRGTAIPATFITEEMDNSRSRRQVLILDCCHSGAFSQGMKGAPGISVGTAAAFQGTGFGRVVLTATDSTQYAWEGDQVIGQDSVVPSVFTQYLIQGLRSGNADTDGDGKITLDELYDYVYEQVVNVTPRQTPSKWSYGQQGDIIIAHNPHPVVKPAALPPDLQQTIDDPRSWVREGAVRELERLLRSSTPGLALAAREALKHLCDDDSRRVSTAAAQSLAAVETPRAAEILPASRPAVDPLTSKPIMAMTGLSAAAATDRTPGISPGQHEATYKEQAGIAPEHNEAQSSRQVLDNVIRHLAQLWQSTLWMKILLISAAWAAGGYIAGSIGWESGNWPVALLLGGVIGGLSIVLTLLNNNPPIPPGMFMLITAALAMGWALDGTISTALSKTISDALVNKIYGPIGWDTADLLLKTIGNLIGSLLVGGISLLPVALALRQAGRPLRGQPFWGILIGWALVWGVCNTSLAYLIQTTEVDASNTIIIALALCTLLIGALGSQNMFWQIAKDRSG